MTIPGTEWIIPHRYERKDKWSSLDLEMMPDDFPAPAKPPPRSGVTSERLSIALIWAALMPKEWVDWLRST